MNWLKLVSLVCLLSGALHAENLDLSKGVMTAGGLAMLQYHANDISKWSSDNFNFGVAANFGFFILKDLAVVFNFTLQGKVASGFDAARRYEFAPGVLYAFETDSNLKPYVQLLGHAAYVQSGWSTGFSPSVGLLVGLTNQVALDFGLTSKFDFAISREGATQLDLGAGYVGIRAFF